MAEVRVLGEYRRTERLWLVIPMWDEGDEWEPAQGTASLVIAPTQADAEKAIDGVQWTEVIEMPRRGALTEDD